MKRGMVMAVAVAAAVAVIALAGQTARAEQRNPRELYERARVMPLPPGQYGLTVEVAGFKKFSSGRFTLAVQQQATVDARLDPPAPSRVVSTITST